MIGFDWLPPMANFLLYFVHVVIQYYFVLIYYSILLIALQYTPLLKVDNFRVLLMAAKPSGFIQEVLGKFI